ncbi:hypothetical protein AWZ03_012198 [Drosophila navojoa]|uniref:Uncharacterized protein n=1 Tax=Drosophila navojoa TaxID=7232 RepID=A0A484AZY2_DRONA|nr:hypothetical protein AWZ03_012198 [Drosophila navojoa]
MNLTGVLNGVLCSITKDKTCGVISNNYNDEGAVCWACATACQCDRIKFSKAAREADLTSFIYLESFQILMCVDMEISVLIALAIFQIVSQRKILCS